MQISADFCKIYRKSGVVYRQAKFERYENHHGDIMNNIIFIEAFTTDPAFNLAMEEYLFEAMPGIGPTL